MGEARARITIELSGAPAAMHAWFVAVARVPRAVGTKVKAEYVLLDAEGEPQRRASEPALRGRVRAAQPRTTQADR